jgi:cytochrome c
VGGWLRPRVLSRLGVLACVGVVSCSSGSSGSSGSGGSRDPATPPFTGVAPSVAMTNAPPAAAAAPTPAGQAPTGIQGTPEQNNALPLEPGGSAVPVDNGVTGTPPSSDVPSDMTPSTTPEPPKLENVLVFSRTVGYRHAAIPAGIQAITTLGGQNGFAVNATEDPARFTDEGLAIFDVVVFLSTTMDVLDDTQQAAFERYIRAGGGWVGVHAASDTEYTWPWYGQLLGNGAFFLGHPAIQQVTVVLEGAPHVSTQHLPATFQVTDELYSFQKNPRPSVNVLMRLDESTYNQERPELSMGDHPIAWYHEFDGGRAWYTGLGHTNEMYSDPRFTQHLLGGIRWAAGVVP